MRLGISTLKKDHQDLRHIYMAGVYNTIVLTGDGQIVNRVTCAMNGIKAVEPRASDIEEALEWSRITLRK